MGTPASQGRLAQIARALATYVEYQRELGVLGFPRSNPATAPNPRPVRVDASPRDLFTEAGVAQARTLAELREAIGDCHRCKLAPHRTHVVFGVGNPRARLVFVGEAPGRDEDIQGQPFVGRAGQLLTDIIKAMKLTRDDVYIANVIKCRPPENRNPEPDELEACRPWIRRQIEIIQPKVIVTLGRFALQSLTGKGYAVSSIRGQWIDYEGI